MAARKVRMSPHRQIVQKILGKIGIPFFSFLFSSCHQTNEVLKTEFDWARLEKRAAEYDFDCKESVQDFRDQFQMKAEKSLTGNNIIDLPSPLQLTRIDSSDLNQPRQENGPLIELRVRDKFLQSDNYVLILELINHNSQQGRGTLNILGYDRHGNITLSTTEEIFFLSFQKRLVRKEFSVSSDTLSYRVSIQ